MTNVGYVANTGTYETKYQTGYGLVHPDGHVIRFHRHILEYELGPQRGTMLDYGCGLGSHLYYFLQNGYTPYGCDVSQTAIERCKTLMPEHADHFHVIPSIPRLRDYFNLQFDLVFSNQVLYYLNDRDMKNVVSQLYALTKPGGTFFATMIAPTNYYAKFVEGTEGGLSKVVLKGRLNEVQCVNFKTRQQVLELFNTAGFKTWHMGDYGAQFREDEGRTDHWLFVGRK